jgi:hypothetical protein
MREVRASLTGWTLADAMVSYANGSITTIACP